jgi:hypothetical protein
MRWRGLPFFLFLAKAISICSAAVDSDEGFAYKRLAMSLHTIHHHAVHHHANHHWLEGSAREVVFLKQK